MSKEAVVEEAVKLFLVRHSEVDNVVWHMGALSVCHPSLLNPPGDDLILDLEILEFFMDAHYPAESKKWVRGLDMNNRVFLGCSDCGGTILPVDWCRCD